MHKKMLIICAIVLQIGCMSYAAEEKEKDAAGNDIRKATLATRKATLATREVFPVWHRVEVMTSRELIGDRLLEMMLSTEDSGQNFSAEYSSLKEDTKSKVVLFVKATTGFIILGLVGRLIWRS